MWFCITSLSAPVAVVVAGAALEGEVLLPVHLDLLDVLGVPDRGEEGVVAAQGEQVLHRRHAEHVVDAEDGLLARLCRPCRPAVWFSATASSRLSPNGFSSAIRLPAGRPAPPSAVTVGAEQPGRQREVGGDRAFAGRGG